MSEFTMLLLDCEENILPWLANNTLAGHLKMQLVHRLNVLKTRDCSKLPPDFN